MGEDEVDRTLYGDLVSYLPDQPLAKMDVSTMAHSLEARSPLLDTALTEYSASIPTYGCRSIQPSTCLNASPSATCPLGCSTDASGVL